MGLDAYEIGNTGEVHAARWMVANGYRNLVCDTKLPGACDIEADHRDGAVLVQVKTAVAPNEPAMLSEEEAKNLKARAARLNRKAFVARVLIDENKVLVREIEWTTL